MDMQKLFQEIVFRRISQLCIDGKNFNVRYHVGSNKFVISVDGEPRTFTRSALYNYLLGKDVVKIEPKRAAFMKGERNVRL